MTFKHGRFCLNDVEAQALAGFSSGFLSRIVVAPFDVVKIRMQIEVNLKGNKRKSTRRRLLNWIKTIKEQEGIKGFWRGTVPGISLWATYAFFQFPTYKYTSSVLSSYIESNHVVSFVSGAWAALIAQTLAYPLDTLRTRHVSQDVETARSGLLKLVRKITRSQGISGFYAGLNPTLLQVVPGMALTFMFYETIPIGLKEKGTLNSLYRGAVAGFMSKIIIYPLDTIKKRLQLAGTIVGVPRYTGIFGCALTMIEKEGPFSFYRGLAPTLMKSTIATACSFYVYENTFKLLQDRMSCSLIS